MHPFLIPIFLYPETHFRFFRLFPSLIYKEMPEVVFDLPRRLGPAYNLPVVLIVNDANRFPCDVVNVQISLSHQSRPPRVFTFDHPERHIVDHPFSFQSKVFVFEIARTEFCEGLYFVNCIARIKKLEHSGAFFMVINDNLFMTSKLPYSCRFSDLPLPGSDFCSYGDMHAHSHYSQSHVEFGPPVSIIDKFSSCYGNDFSVVTDHSYDLACEMDNFLRTDNSLSRWKSARAEISNHHFIKPCILGEEISCLNSKNKAVHLCGIGIKDFVPGSIDGARQNAKTIKTLSLKNAIESIHRQGGIAYAAHPGSKMGVFQRVFLKRGIWSRKDLSENLDAVQNVNNGFNSSWNRANKLWINELLKGHKLPLLGGNDCHGDFNRYRYLKTPFLLIQENFMRYFSWIKTGIYRKISNQQNLIEAIKNGETFVTSGPFLGISKTKSILDNIICHNEIVFNLKSISIILRSNSEFGQPYFVKLNFGQIFSSREQIFFSKYLKLTEFEAVIEVPISNLTGKGYLRAEAEFLKSDGTMNFAATSPYYFNLTSEIDQGT